MSDGTVPAGARREILRRAPGATDVLPGHLHPVLRRVYAARGVGSADDLDLDLQQLLPVSTLAALAMRALRGLLFGVHPLDPANLVLTVLAIGGFAALASYLPARRAGRVDPVELLRTE